MRILLVLDQFDGASNGTTVSSRRFANELQRRGNDVRVITTASNRPAAELAREDGFRRWTVPPLSLPGFNGIIAKQDMRLGRPKTAPITEAIEWAEVVHIATPFWLGRRAKKIAERRGKPATAAFHVQPENITYNFGLGRLRIANWAIYRLFRGFFNSFGHVHCPSNFIAGEVIGRGYTSKMHVISNGVDPGFRYRKLPKTPDLADAFVITMIGRLSPEKRQDVLLDAVARSRYADRIQVVLAGKGPRAAKLAEQGAGLTRVPILAFYTQDELHTLLAMTDLYVHASDAEIEAISCIEAFSSGLVPVIADSKQSATPQFALDERSLFAAGDAGALAERIDYWLSDETERKATEERYAEAGAKYGLGRCVERIEAMLREAMTDQERVG
ncbi:MAG: glycosyltransferase [Promicromonosporaceae bacterium]|nr:glycosyltransferase [Promicromonosporaceae bacterium]